MLKAHLLTGHKIGIHQVSYVGLDDTDGTNYLNLDWNEDDSSDRWLYLKVHSGNRTLDLYENFTIGDGTDITITGVGQANTLTLYESLTLGDGYTGTLTFSAASKVLTVEASSVVSQDYSTDASPVFAGLEVNGSITLANDETISNASDGVIAIDGTLGITTGAKNLDGIVFGSLGTATKGIDMSSAGLTTNSDYYLYNTSINFWRADGFLRASGGMMSDRYIGQYGSVELATRSDTNWILQLSSSSSKFFGKKPAIGSLTDCTSNGTTTIAKSSTWGFTPVTGDLLHLTDSAQTGDKGYYRVVTVNLNISIIVDRALTGSLSDVDITIYQDVIGFFATDGTNGQHLVGFSHQDKPLVIGGDRAGTGLGTVPATGHSLGGEDIMIGSLLEVDGMLYADGGVEASTAVVQAFKAEYNIGAQLGAWVHGVKVELTRNADIQPSTGCWFGGQFVLNAGSSGYTALDKPAYVLQAVFKGSDTSPNGTDIHVARFETQSAGKVSDILYVTANTGTTITGSLAYLATHVVPGFAILELNAQSSVTVPAGLKFVSGAGSSYTYPIDLTGITVGTADIRFSTSNIVKFDSAAPVSGTWIQGDVVFNTGASAGGTVGWVCTSAGTPGTWKTFGDVSA